MYSKLIATVLVQNRETLYNIFLERLKTYLVKAERKSITIVSNGIKEYFDSKSIEDILKKNIKLRDKIKPIDLEMEFLYDDKEFNKYIKESLSPETIDDNLYLILKCYFENSLEQKEEENITNHINNNLMIFENFNFKVNEKYFNIFDKFTHLTFDNCYFNISQKSMFKNNNTLELEFNNSKFINKWGYIKSENTIYSECYIDSYTYINISENRKEIKPLLFFDCNIKNINFEGVSFSSRLFKFSNLMTYKEINSIKFINCKINKDFILNNSNHKINGLLKIKEIDLTNSVFTKGTKVKIQFFDIGNATFYNTKFEDLADFYQTKFMNVNFKRTDFLSISVFSEAIFNCNVDFSYVKFFGKAIFRDTIINGKLNLRDTLFDDEANFLDIKRNKNISLENSDTSNYVDIEVENRETARIIKNFYDNSNNIIEANKFYALEMKEREKELEKDRDNGKNLLEWLVFRIHGLASNHSQDWFLSTLWIIIFSFVVGLFNQKYYFDWDKYIFISAILLIPFIIGIKFDRIKRIIGLSLFTILFYLFTYIDLDFVANLINPFSIMTGKEELTFGLLIYKIVIAYLLYQLIISIRQNTRRK